jgi:putative ABC transport system substrate-binding protein
LTSTIPIVFGDNLDPVQSGIVTNPNRPGGNVTGIAFMSAELGAKRLGLLHDLLPRATRFAVLVNRGPIADTLIADMRAAAAATGLEIEVFQAGTNAEIDTAFASLAQKRIEALQVSPLVLFSNRRAQILALAARHALPVIYGNRADVEAGGLMSYGANLSWFEHLCEVSNNVEIGNESYFIGANGDLMPTQKDQPPPGLTGFDQKP